MIKTQTYPESSENLNPSKYIYCFGGGGGGEVEWGGGGRGGGGDTNRNLRYKSTHLRLIKQQKTLAAPMEARAQTVHVASGTSVTVPETCSSEADVHDVNTAQRKEGKPFPRWRLATSSRRQRKLIQRSLLLDVMVLERPLLAAG